MPKEKRNNLAIYTLAGSILLSSVIVSMNQSNAHTSDSTEISRLKECVNSNMSKIGFAFMDIESGNKPFFIRKKC
jgi:hypothetical protein